MNILLSLPVLLHDTARLDAIHKQFETAGFVVVSRELSADAISIDCLGPIVDGVKSDYPDARRIVVVGNVMMYLFAWYRVWNHSIQDFVLVTDPQSPAFNADPTEPVANRLGVFLGAERDPLYGRIYLDIDPSTMHLYRELLLTDRFIARLAPLTAFPFEEPSTQPLSIRKLYTLDEQTFATGPENGPFAKIVDLGGSVSVNDLVPSTVSERSPELVPYICAALAAREELDWLRRNQAMHSLVAAFQGQSSESTRRMVDVFAQIFRTQCLELQPRCMLAFQAVMNLPHPTLLRAWADAVPDYEDTKFEFQAFFLHYLMSVWLAIEPYPEFYQDQCRMLERLVGQHAETLLPLVFTPAERGSKRLLVMIGEADGVRYAPLQSATHICVAFKRAHPDWSIGLLITDRHRVDKGELGVWEFRPESQEYEEAICDLFEGLDIDFIVAEAKWNRTARMVKLLDDVRAWKPSHLLSVADDRDIVRGLLAPDYPMLEFSIGSLCVKPDFVDVMLTDRDESTWNEVCDLLLVPDQVRKSYVCFPGPISVLSPKRVHDREAYGLPESAFVLTVFGYNLRWVLREECITMLLDLVERYDQLHLLFVGHPRLPSVECRLRATNRSQVHIQPPTDDLAGLLGICDLVFCPKQEGGALGHATAVNLGVPVVVEDYWLGDFPIMLGRENAEVNFAACSDAIERAITDPDYRTEISKRNATVIRARLANNDVAMEWLFDALPLAERRFLRRKDGRSGGCT